MYYFGYGSRSRSNQTRFSVMTAAMVMRRFAIASATRIHVTSRAIWGFSTQAATSPSPTGPCRMDWATPRRFASDMEQVSALLSKLT